MKICIDGLGATRLMGTGMGTYTMEFLKNLFYMYPQPDYELLVEDSKPEINLGKNMKNLLLNLNINRRDNDYSSIEKHITDNKVNIYHSPNNGFSIPENKSCNYISTIHDLLPLVNSKYVDDKYMKKFIEVFPSAVKNSDKIIVVSNFLKEQLKNNYDIPEKDIIVNYPGCSPIFKPKNLEICEDILRSKYKITEDFILHVGAIHIRKNLDKLIKAFKNVNSINRNLKLVLVGKYDGKRAEYYEKLKELINSLELNDSVIFTGTIDYLDMPFFYSSSKCVVNLSKYEGFPISSIEAMACGTPVIWNNEAFFREVLGTSGIQVDANDNDQLVQTLIDIVFNGKASDNLLKSQIEQAATYKWEKNIINTIRVYESFF